LTVKGSPVRNKTIKSCETTVKMMNWKQLSGKFILNLALFICVGGELPFEVNDRDAVQHVSENRS